MPSYDANHFDPPAPVAEVELRNAQTGSSIADVELLIDSGADVTLIPRVPVEQLGVAVDPGQGMELWGFDGSRSFVPIVTLDIVFLGRIYRGRYLLTEDQRGIMGRDVLNHLRLLLDGPQEEWTQA